MTVTRIKHDTASPNVPCLIEVLAAYQVHYVVVGSVAAQLYGVEVQSGDFDIVPALELNNLTHLTQVLQDLEAALPDTDEIGRWELQADGEQKWVSRKATPQERLQRAKWVPQPEDVATLDALFYTRCGNFDVVPELVGAYETLIQRATKMKVYGQDVWVTHVDELLARLTIPRRPKDVSRVRQLREIQRQPRS